MTTPTTPVIEQLMAAREKIDACEVNANGDRLIDNHGDELGRFPDCPDLAQFASLAFDNVEAVAAEMKSLRRSVQFYKSRVEEFQNWQRLIPDPWRKQACNIIANGSMSAESRAPKSPEPKRINLNLSPDNGDYFVIESTPSEDLSGSYVLASDYERLQARVEAVTPLVGKLLDAWEGMPNDLKADVESESPSIVEAIKGLFEVTGE